MVYVRSVTAHLLEFGFCALIEDVNELRKREKTRDLVPLSALESVAVFQQNQFIHSLIGRTYTKRSQSSVGAVYDSL